MLDTFGSMATNCGDVVGAEAGKERPAKGPTLHCVLHDYKLSYLSSRLGL